MSKINILIVEDEFMIAEDIAMRLTDFGYNVVGHADSASKAIGILESHPVDLVLVDINIAGETDGIELASIINDKFNLPFIFLTSLASKSIVDRALKTNPSAFLLKPFNDRQVQVSIELALRNFENREPATGVNEPAINEKYSNANLIAMRDSLFLKKDSHFERIRFSEIHYLEAESNYTTLVTDSGRFMYSCVLKNFEERLPKDVFLRVHRSFLVNMNMITGFEGKYLHLGQSRIPVSRKRREEMLGFFDVI
ncbi:MAG: LytTR family transcriptional regulator DNA-binding domain-containing protein [Prolixibacteraceae bacterium]|jgi:DNA-binding LytR/AlgR family response regulator|nr:LytTR family transcriptional regulator DNA-binding domain-containing protein [Prolixibacteraceae bacterium]